MEFQLDRTLAATSSAREERLAASDVARVGGVSRYCVHLSSRSLQVEKEGADAATSRKEAARESKDRMLAAQEENKTGSHLGFQ